MDLFPIKVGGQGFIALLIVLALNAALWFGASIVIAKGVEIGWNL